MNKILGSILFLFLFTFPLPENSLLAQEEFSIHIEDNDSSIIVTEDYSVVLSTVDSLLIIFDDHPVVESIQKGLNKLLQVISTMPGSDSSREFGYAFSVNGVDIEVWYDRPADQYRLLRTTNSKREFIQVCSPQVVRMKTKELILTELVNYYKRIK